MSNPDSSGDSCTLCKNEKHPLYMCTKFKSLSHDEKLSVLKSQNRCLNCLRTGHIAKHCKSLHCHRSYVRKPSRRSLYLHQIKLSCHHKSRGTLSNSCPHDVEHFLKSSTSFISERLTQSLSANTAGQIRNLIGAAITAFLPTV